MEGHHNCMVAVLHKLPGDVLESIDKHDQEATIHVKDGPISASTEVVVLGESQVPPQGFRYLLEVYIATEVLEVWSKWRGGTRPSRADRVAAVAFYTERDAYLPVEEYDV